MSFTLASLRARLLVFLLGLATVVALVLGTVTYRSVLADTDALLDYQLRQMALTLRDQGAGVGPPAAAIESESADFVVQIWTGDGAVVYASQPGLRLPGTAQLGYSVAQVDGRDWRVFALATRSRVIQVGQPVDTRRTQAAAAALRSVIPLLLLAPLVAAAVWWIVRLSLAPLGPLTAAVRTRAADSLAPLPTQDLPEEVAPLAQALNGLLARLKVSFDAQRAFVADAAHELRSPITALKLQLDALRCAPDEPARAEATAELAAGMLRAQRLLEQLLTLARTEPGGAEAAMVPTDLSEAARLACADAVPAAQALGAEIELDAPRPVTVQGDGAALRILVRNLVDNAARYAGGAPRIHLSVAREGGQAVLRVDDNGPGIPVAERARVFDRFYRRDGQGPSGSGLGLAIVQAIAQRHRAELRLAEAPLGGLRVELRLPVQAPS